MDPSRLKGELCVAVAGRTILEAHTDGGPAAPRFQAASVSKLVVATCVLSLVEHGAISLGDELGRRWPGVPAAWRGIEVSRLLTHTAGLPHWGELDGVDLATRPPSRDELVALAAEVPLRRTPAQWSYSGVGYLAAASVVEAAADAPYAEVVRQLVLEPLGMTASSSGAVPDAATAAGSRAGVAVDCPPGLSALPGTGDLWTTAADLTRFAQGLLSGALLGTDALEAMLAPRVTIAAPPRPGALLRATGQGLGPRVGTLEGRTVWFHQGDNPGYASMLALLPERTASVAILASDEAADLEPVLHVALEEACAA